VLNETHSLNIELSLWTNYIETHKLRESKTQVINELIMNLPIFQNFLVLQTKDFLSPLHGEWYKT
jgi:hypothetical protein